MPKIRVLVVDDAVVVRRLVSDVLSEDPDIEVVGIAPNGRIALSKLPQVNPDVVILDVEMPEMDGLTTLKEIRKTYRLLPVIMFSTLTQRGAEATLDALSFGASDYVTKPANVGSVGAAMEAVRSTLIPKIKQFCGRGVPIAKAIAKPSAPTITTAAAPTLVRRPSVSSLPSRVEILAIGTSTGGPDALNRVLPLLPADFPVPIVVVQHMPPMFTQLLADRLDSKSAIRVREAKEGSALEAGLALVAPGDFHLSVVEREGKRQARVFSGPPENSCRPAVDVLFRSVAEHYGPSALAVVLTGMGQDGLRGSEHVREVGGQVFAQDEATSVVWGMPGYVAQAGLAHQILSIDEVAQAILRAVAHGRATVRAGYAMAGGAL